MEMALNMGAFEALDQDALLLVDGGVNWWGVASGVLTCVGAGLGIAASALDPEPVSKTLGMYSSISYFGAGISAIGWAFS